jgi:hypothetical protein
MNRGRKPVDVALECKQRGFIEMLAAFISPPPPREQQHFDAILRLAVFFEDVAGANDDDGDEQGGVVEVPAEDGQTRHLKPITIRTMAGAAAQQCLNALRTEDAVVRMVRRAGYDSDARPLGCPHGARPCCCRRCSASPCAGVLCMHAVRVWVVLPLPLLLPLLCMWAGVCKS